MSTRYNLLSPELAANPYPIYAEMRRNTPVCQVDPGGMWAVTRYDDVLHVMKNPQLFSSAGFGVALNPPWLGGNPLSYSMLPMDPPQHGRLRALVSRAFAAPSIARLESRVRALAEKAVAELPMGQSVDLMPAYGLRIAASVIGDMMGLDPALHTRLKQWADLITDGVIAIPDEAEDRKQVAREAVADLRRYFTELLDRRRREPVDDMVSELLRARVDGVALTQDELISFLVLLLVGGIETVEHLMDCSILMLLEQPELMARLRADRSLIPPFIEEVLRYEPPAHTAPRVTTAEVELSGVRLPPGTPVLAMLGSACHDETHFPDADRFDMTRPGPQNLPFGHGAHFCLGMHLARMEARLALDAFLNRFGRVERGAEPMTWHRGLVVRGPGKLPVVLHPA